MVSLFDFPVERLVRYYVLFLSIWKAAGLISPASLSARTSSGCSKHIARNGTIDAAPVETVAVFGMMEMPCLPFDHRDSSRQDTGLTGAKSQSECLRGTMDQIG